MVKSVPCTAMTTFSNKSSWSILQLDYTAPEYALLGSITPAADMFSFGMVAYSVFTRHVFINLFHTVEFHWNDQFRKPLFQNNRTWGVFKRNASELRTLPASRLQEVGFDPQMENHNLDIQVPADLRDYLKLLLSLTPDLRPTPEQVRGQNWWQAWDNSLKSGAAAALLRWLWCEDSDQPGLTVPVGQFAKVSILQGKGQFGKLGSIS